MKRVRVGIIGTGSLVEWTLLPTLSSPDAVAPPDTGAWWARRSDNSDIQYQAPARPEIVAIAECESELRSRRVERVAQAARVRSTYLDWRSMLREVELDALICVAPPAVTAEVIAATGGTKPLWIYGVPAASFAALTRLRAGLSSRETKLWCSWPLRQASAHRTATQLIERDQIGAPTGLTLRWPNAWELTLEHEPERFASTLAALDLVCNFAEVPGASTRSHSFALPSGACASECNGATQILLRFANGTSATALFAGAETWSTALPRLEICGTQGRSILCEAGRRLWLHHPREAARFWEPPGISHHVSSANVAGVAEDLKAFLAFCVDEKTTSSTRDTRTSLHSWEMAWRWQDAINMSLEIGEFVRLSHSGAPEAEVQNEEAQHLQDAPLLPPTLKLPL